MGVCASCIGRRRSDSLDEDDVSRLLFDDANNMQYGSFGEHNVNSQADPLESQREVEALQRVVARTSKYIHTHLLIVFGSAGLIASCSNLVDIFEIAPQESQRTHPSIFSSQDARLARYQNILSKLSSPEDGLDSEVVEWIPGEDEISDWHGKNPSVKEVSGEPLVGTFADAVPRAA
ncbi:hypothetical protein DL771_004988 [Monosporascus sp. 5C6A]|nr:hypothetical protein DL771_004988 [Monosporascus sp. 5C6A]